MGEIVFTQKGPLPKNIVCLLNEVKKKASYTMRMIESNCDDMCVGVKSIDCDTKDNRQKVLKKHSKIFTCETRFCYDLLEKYVTHVHNLNNQRRFM